MEVKKEIVEDSELKKEFNVTIPLELINSKVEKETTDRLKTYRLDGFRVGKVPLEIFKKKEGDYLFVTVAEKAIGEAVFDILKQNDYNLTIQPAVTIKTMEIDKDVEFKVKYELMPTVSDVDFSKIKLNKYNVIIGENRINRAIDEVLLFHKKWVKKDDVAVLGDSVKINFIGRVDNVEFDGGKGENYQLELGSHSFIDTFEEQLVNKKEGDEVLVNVTFPENYHKSSLAGKAAVFEVKVLEVLKSEKNELNDDFVKSNFGAENVEKFKELLTKELENSYNNVVREGLRREIFDKLDALYDFALPEEVITEQFKIDVEKIEKENLRLNKNEKIDEEKVRKEARKLVKITYILHDIAVKNKITVNEDELTLKIMNMAMSMPGYEKMFIDYYKKNEKGMNIIRNQILEDKIVDLIIEKSDKNEISISDEEFEKNNNLEGNGS
jgi:trigger factor